MTNYYYFSDGIIRSYNTPATTSATWNMSLTRDYHKKRSIQKHRIPIDDLSEDNEKLDKFLETFAQKGTDDGE